MESFEVTKVIEVTTNIKLVSDVSCDITEYQIVIFYY